MGNSVEPGVFYQRSHAYALPPLRPLSCPVRCRSRPGTGSGPVRRALSITLSEDQIRDLIRRSADNDLENDKKQRDYTYVEREEVRRLDGKGQVKSTEVKTYDVMEIYGEQVQKLIAKNDTTALRQRREERRRKDPEAHRQAQEMNRMTTAGSVWKKSRRTGRRAASS